jgi:hypothetical protein
MNYYETLGVAAGASAEEVKRGYFAKVREGGPDRDPEGFRLVRAAFDVLRNPKKRAEYDGFFKENLSDGEQRGILEAREMMSGNKFKEAAEFLKDLAGRYGGAAVKRLYAEALWQSKKSGTADRICAEILAEWPKDYETALLRGGIAVSMGHTRKGGEHFAAAIALEPRNPKGWAEYMRAANKNGGWLDKSVAHIFQEAMAVSEDIFADKNYYPMYMYGGAEMSEMYAGNVGMPYLRRFLEFFAEDDTRSLSTYRDAIELIPDMLRSENKEGIDFLEQLLPVLEKSKHRTAKAPGDFLTSDEKIKIARSTLAVRKMKNDDQVHESLKDLTMQVMAEDKEEIRATEAYIVYNLPLLQQSIKHLRENHPEQFALNQKFYTDCLDNKKQDALIQKYNSVRMIPDYDGQGETFVRGQPKISRNAPCPCGSGRKYKQCCLKT